MWLNLNIDAVEFIFQYIEKHPEYMPRFDYTRLSDELFFHSILLGNDFEQKDKIVCDDMRFVDWETGPQYPRVFTITDLDRLSSTKNFFARKFDCSIDNQIIEELYRRI